jgi:hypothetical protein
MQGSCQNKANLRSVGQVSNGCWGQREHHGASEHIREKALITRPASPEPVQFLKQFQSSLLQPVQQQQGGLGAGLPGSTVFQNVRMKSTSCKAHGMNQEAESKSMLG